MATIDTRPQVVDIIHYAGDTLTIEVTAPDALVSGKTWNAQVRSTRDSAVIAATFQVTPSTGPGVPTYLTLDSATCASLAGTQGLMARSMEAGVLNAVMRFTGVWDVQISDAGSDPVRTLAQGTLTIELDVTRSAP